MRRRRARALCLVPVFALLLGSPGCFGPFKAVKAIHDLNDEPRSKWLKELVFLAFAYDSRTKGNAGTEIAKAFLQLHFHIKKDYLNHDLLKKGNFYRSN